METLNELASIGRGLLSWWPSVTLWTSALLLVAFVLDRVLRSRVGPGTRALLFAAVILRAALPGDWQAPLAVVEQIDASPSVVLAAAAPAPAAPLLHERTADEALVAAALAPKPSLDTTGLGLFAIYLCGVVVLLGATLMRLRAHTMGSVERMNIADATAWIHATQGPMIVGLRAPRIVLPRALLSEVEPDVLGAVVRHELAHIRHRDGWVALALALACALAWPIIPVWIAAGRIRLAMEMRADADAIASLPEPGVRGYRRLLLELADRRWRGPEPALGLGAVAGLRVRLAAMKLAPRTPWALQLLVTAPLAIALIVCAGTRELAPPAPLAAVLGNVADATVDTRTIPFPHCKGADPRKVIPVPADDDAAALTNARARIHLMSKALLEPEEGTMDWTPGMSELFDSLRTNGPALAYAEARYVRGLAHLRHGRLADALQDLGEAAWYGASTEDDYLATEAAFALVVVEEAAGHADEAKSWSHHAFAAARRVGISAQPMRAPAERALARIAQRVGRDDDAAEHLRAADDAEASCTVVPAG